MTEDAENSGDPILKDQQFGPDLSETSPLRRRLIGYAMIAAFVGIVLIAVFTT